MCESSNFHFKMSPNCLAIILRPLNQPKNVPTSRPGMSIANISAVMLNVPDSRNE